MVIYEWDDVTTFEFKSDLIVNNQLIAQFDTDHVEAVVDLLKQHNITNWQIRIGTDEHNFRTVVTEVHEKLSDPFHYDLTNKMLEWG